MVWPDLAAIVLILDFGGFAGNDIPVVIMGFDRVPVVVHIAAATEWLMDDLLIRRAIEH